jgi:hypothetical protein
MRSERGGAKRFVVTTPHAALASLTARSAVQAPHQALLTSVSQLAHAPLTRGAVENRPCPVHYRARSIMSSSGLILGRVCSPDKVRVRSSTAVMGGLVGRMTIGRRSLCCAEPHGRLPSHEDGAAARVANGGTLIQVCPRRCSSRSAALRERRPFPATATGICRPGARPMPSSLMVRLAGRLVHGRAALRERSRRPSGLQ